MMRSRIVLTSSGGGPSSGSLALSKVAASTFSRKLLAVAPVAILNGEHEHSPGAGWRKCMCGLSMLRSLPLLALLALSGCATMIQPIPGMTLVAVCASGPAYHYRQELICDTKQDVPFFSRKLEPNDNANSACTTCEAWAKFR